MSIIKPEEMQVEEFERVRNEILTEEFARKADQVFARRRSHDFLRSIGFLLGDMGNLYMDLRPKHKTQVAERKSEHTVEEMVKLVMLFYKDLDQEIYERVASFVNSAVRVPYKNGRVPAGKVDGEIQRFFEKTGSRNRNFLFYTKDLLDPKVADTCNSSVGLDVVEQNGEKVDCRVAVFNIVNTIQGYYTIAHELGHISSQRMVEMKSARADFVGEIESLFMEKLFNNYMLDWGMITEEEHKAHTTKRRESLKNDLSKMLQEADLLSVVKPPITHESLVEAEEIFRTDPKYSKNYPYLMLRLAETVNTNRSAAYMYRYVVGELVSSALLDDYIKDPVATMGRYKEFLFSNADKTYGELLTGLLGEGYETKIRQTAGRMVEDCIESDRQNA